MSLLVWMLQRSRYLAFAFSLLLLLIMLRYELSVQPSTDSFVQSETNSLTVRAEPPLKDVSVQKLQVKLQPDEFHPLSAEDRPSSAVEDELLRNEFLRTPYIFDKFTMVTPTYRRTGNLPSLFNHYCPMVDIIHKIIILWNNVDVEVPPDILEEGRNCQIPVVIKIMPRNNLTSRFIPYAEIETAGVLSIDDDLQLSLNSIHLAFSTWKTFPHLLVGYTPRTYFKRNDMYKYHYNAYKGTYTMMMTNVAFIHRKYLELFTNTVPKDITDFIHKETNGEDITMNTVVGKYLTDLGRPQCVALYVNDEGLKEIGNLSKSGYKGLWRRKGHMRQRSRCLNMLNDAYGQLYLHQCDKKVSNETELSFSF